MPLAAAACIYSTERFSPINTTTDFHVFPSYTVLFRASNSAYIRKCKMPGSTLIRKKRRDERRRKGESIEIHCVLGVRGGDVVNGREAARWRFASSA